MPYLCHYHMQFFISTFLLGNSGISYYNINRPVLPSDLFFMSESRYKMMEHLRKPWLVNVV